MDFNLNHSVLILEKTPEVINAMLQNIPEPWAYNNEGKDTWSPFDIIGHLVHGEHTDWIPRAKIILSDQAQKNFEPFDRFAQFENSKNKSLETVLQEFQQLRKLNIEQLKAFHLTEEQLQLTGNHPELGTVTLQQLLATWVVHDLSHIHQITRVLAKNYTDQVGPWVQYISIIDG